MVPSLHKEDADWEIVEGFQRGDEEVQKRFYRRCRTYYEEHRMSVFDFHAQAPTPEDLFHDAFLTLWEEMQTYVIRTRGGKVYRLDSEGKERKMTANLQTFLMAIAKYKNMELGRESDTCSLLVVDIKASPEDEEEEERIVERVVIYCVDQLPYRCRDILTKFYFEGLSLDEILAVRKEHVSKDGLKTGKAKCMKMLKERMQEILRTYKIKGYGEK